MTLKELNEMYNEAFENGYDHIEFKGNCNDCGKEVSVIVFKESDLSTDLSIIGGAVYNANKETNNFDLKCQECFDNDPVLHNQPCEVYARVVG